MDNIPFMKPYLGNNARTCPQSTGNNPVFVHLTGAPQTWTLDPHWSFEGGWSGPGSQGWDFSLVWLECGVCEPPGAWSLVSTALWGHQHHKMSCLFWTSSDKIESVAMVDLMTYLMTYCECFFWYLANVISFHLQFPASSLIMQQNQPVLVMTRHLHYFGLLWYKFGLQLEFLVWCFMSF